VNLYIECPKEWGDETEDPEDETIDWPAIFLGGGITGAPDWQTEISTMLDHCIILNPRRANFPMHDPHAAQEQIEWEHRHLRRADGILFWFPKINAAGCPITLYELGAWTMTTKPIFIGIEPGYVRESDVRIQTQLARPNIPILGTLETLAEVVNNARW
jgi:hypothetical protein